MERKAGYAVATVLQRIGDHEYRLRTLRDRQQFSDPSGDAERAGISSATWPLFGVLWPAGIALATELDSLPLEGKAILEIGCGIGLSSLVLQRRGADITASDYHPLVEEFLQFNAVLNCLPPVKFSIAPWAGPNPHLGRFDLIVGSDLLYEPDHPELLAGFIALHAKPSAQVLITDPGRRQFREFSVLMAEQGYAVSERRIVFPGAVQTNGRLLTYAR
jgi:predicted nicotinamide N-methyase